jgi:hypothetical protein
MNGLLHLYIEIVIRYDGNIIPFHRIPAKDRYFIFSAVVRTVRAAQHGPRISFINARAMGWRARMAHNCGLSANIGQVARRNVLGKLKWRRNGAILKYVDGE